jgi:Ser/Thr protein kinase RdoA (MazF antagonist)
MIDFPLTDLLDDAACAVWLEQNLHPTGLVCPRCHSSDRRLFRRHAFFLTYRCRTCQRTYTIVDQLERGEPLQIIELAKRLIEKRKPNARRLVIHNDIKPQNVTFQRDYELNRAYVIAHLTTRCHV